MFFHRSWFIPAARLLGCAARCQTTPEREQVVPTQSSFRGTDSLFDDDLVALLNRSATSSYRFSGQGVIHSLAVQNITMSKANKIPARHD